MADKDFNITTQGGGGGWIVIPANNPDEWYWLDDELYETKEDLREKAQDMVDRLRR